MPPEDARQRILDEPGYAEALLAYVSRKYGSSVAESERVLRAILADMTEPQRALTTDPAKTKIAICGRRSGKTDWARRICLVAPLQKPDSFACYVALTRKNAKLQVWPRLLRLVEKYRIPAKPNHSDLTLIYSNGSTLFLGGADTTAEIQKYRGLDVSFALLDEAAAMADHILRELIEEILEPTLVDHQGTLAAISTPGPVLAGYLYDRSANPATPERHVPTHHWTIFDNPHIQHARQWLDERMRQNCWDAMHPTYRREWLGEWVADDEALIYHFNPDINGWDGALPASGVRWQYCLGVDVGYSPDPTAFCLLAHAPDHPIAYVVHTEKHLELTPSRIAERMHAFTGRYNVTRIVADLGGAGGKGLEVEWRQRFRVPLHAPKDKHRKREHIAIVDDALRNGRLRVKTGLSVIHELQTVVWDEDRKRPSDAYPNDEADALEYAYLAAKNYAADLVAPLVALAPDEDERARREEEALEQAMLRRHKRNERNRRLGL